MPNMHFKVIYQPATGLMMLKIASTYQIKGENKIYEQ